MKDVIKTFVQSYTFCRLGVCCFVGRLELYMKSLDLPNMNNYCLRLVSLMDLNALGFGL